MPIKLKKLKLTANVRLLFKYLCIFQRIGWYTIHIVVIIYHHQLLLYYT